jgi:hypothetical protein
MVASLDGTKTLSPRASLCRCVWRTAIASSSRDPRGRCQRRSDDHGFADGTFTGRGFGARACGPIHSGNGALLHFVRHLGSSANPGRVRRGRCSLRSTGEAALQRVLRRWESEEGTLRRFSLQREDRLRRKSVGKVTSLFAQSIVAINATCFERSNAF